jgi:hypothetical protein
VLKDKLSIRRKRTKTPNLYELSFHHNQEIRTQFFQKCDTFGQEILYTIDKVCKIFIQIYIRIEILSDSVTLSN